jgi:hypothetical protein
MTIIDFYLFRTQEWGGLIIIQSRVCVISGVPKLEGWWGENRKAHTRSV